jgi:hypothetical protein
MTGQKVLVFGETAQEAFEYINAHAPAEAATRWRVAVDRRSLLGWNQGEVRLVGKYQENPHFTGTDLDRYGFDKELSAREMVGLKRVVVGEWR